MERTRPLLFAAFTCALALTGCSLFERDRDHSETNYGVVGHLAVVASAIQAVDSHAGQRLSVLANQVHDALESSRSESANKNLSAYSLQVFHLADSEVPQELLFEGLDTVIKVQKERRLIPGTTLTKNSCCRRLGIGKGRCEDLKNAKCYTIDKIPNGCLGTPCPRVDG